MDADKLRGWALKKRAGAGGDGLVPVEVDVRSKIGRMHKAIRWKRPEEAAKAIKEGKARAVDTHSPSLRRELVRRFKQMESERLKEPKLDISDYEKRWGKPREDKNDRWRFEADGPHGRTRFYHEGKFPEAKQWAKAWAKKNGFKKIALSGDFL